MSDWKTLTLGHLSTQRKGINYKSDDYGDEHSGHPFITIKCFVKGGGYQSTGIKFYDGFSTKADHLSAGDILFSVTDLTRAGDIVGSPLRVPDFRSTKPALASMDCMRIEPVVDRCNKGFLYHLLMLSDVRRQMVAYSAGSTVLHLDTKKVPSISVYIPVDIQIQSRISFILDGVDAAIEKTEALIAKYQQIKAGLMYDLFTRGVLPSGQLRPPRSEAPELYQETEIGWIPREWQFKRCTDICSRICVGIVIQPTQYYVEDGIPAFRSANVREDGIDPSNFVFISASANRLLVKSQVKAGDIVSVRTGYPGTSAVIPPEFQGANCIDILISTPNEQVSSEYLCDWINSSFGKWQVLRQQGGMAQQHFNVGEMRELLVALPNFDEQERIRNKIKAVSDKLKIEQDLSAKLRAQKLGLMQDLLTGKVPVQVNEPERMNG